MKTLLLIVPFALLAQPEQDIRLQIANAYGFQAWDQVNEIRYTFHVDLSGKRTSRSWVWEPKLDRVRFEGPGSDGKLMKLTYLRTELNTKPTPEMIGIDKAFINDKYWLLFPFQVEWDRSAKVEDTGTHKLPLGKGTGRRVVVTYPPSGGYTPGDGYELFLGKDNRIVEWVHHGGDLDKPGQAFTWEQNRAFGPITVSLRHQGPAGSVTFTGVAVK